MMKSNRKIFHQVFQVGKPEIDKSAIRNEVQESSTNLRKWKMITEKRSVSVSPSRRNSSMQALKSSDHLSVSASTKTVCLKEDSPVQSRNVMAKSLRVLAKKKRELLQLQTTLMQQQEVFISLFAQVKDLEMQSGVDPSKSIGEAQLLSLKGWSGYDLLLLVHGDPKTYGQTDIKGVLGPAILKELDTLLSKIPEDVVNMSSNLMGRRLEVLAYLRTRVRSDASNFPEWKMKMTKFDADTKKLHKLVVDVAKHLETKIGQSLELAKTSWRDRDLLIRKIERLQRQLSFNYIKTGIVPQDPTDDNNSWEKTMNDQCVATDMYWQNTIEELEKERAAGESLRHVVTSAEVMLRSSRQRITTLERQLKTTKSQLDEAIRKHKEYEQLHRSRETRYDACSRKLKQVSKTGEVTIEVLSRQRDALELRVKELQERTQIIAEDYESRLAEQKARIDSIQVKMVEQEKRRSTAEIRVQELEKRLKGIQEEYNQLKEYSDKLVNFDKEKYLEFLPPKEIEPSQDETELWKELQTTKMDLERVTEELQQSRADKESLLESLSRIAQEGPEHKMADELLHREKKITRLQQAIEDLKETINTMKETEKQKDSQLASLRAEVGQILYGCCGHKDITKQGLELEVLDLSAKVASLKRERDSLLSVAAARALMLERHERSSDLFAQVTRTRHEIAARLEGRSVNRPDKESTLIMDKSMRKSLSSVCMKASETWSELKAERERVLQLQNIIITQNLQMERESCIRTQLEERRATLERIFHSSKHLNKSLTETTTRSSYDPPISTVSHSFP